MVAPIWVRTLELTANTNVAAAALYYEKVNLNGFTLTGNAVQEFWDNTGGAGGGTAVGTVGTSQSTDGAGNFVAGHVIDKTDHSATDQPFVAQDTVFVSNYSEYKDVIDASVITNNVYFGQTKLNMTEGDTLGGTNSGKRYFGETFNLNGGTYIMSSGVEIYADIQVDSASTIDTTNGAVVNLRRIVMNADLTLDASSGLSGSTINYEHIETNGFTLTLTPGSGSINNVMWDNTAEAPLTTKGDLYGYGTEATRVPVGTNGQVLQADSTDSEGLKWVDGTTLNVFSNVFNTPGVSWTSTTSAGYPFTTTKDDGSAWSYDAANGNITVPYTGTYKVTYSTTANWNSGSGNNMAIYLSKNDGADITDSRIIFGVAAGTTYYIPGARVWVLDLASGDTIKTTGKCTATGTYTTRNFSMTVEKIG
jgi:hypothetical protein